MHQRDLAGIRMVSGVDVINLTAHLGKDRGYKRHRFLVGQAQTVHNGGRRRR